MVASFLLWQEVLQQDHAVDPGCQAVDALDGATLLAGLAVQEKPSDEGQGSQNRLA